MKEVQEKTVELVGRNFKDLEGKSKSLRKKNGKLIHTGNENYFQSTETVIHHQVKKVLKQFKHKSGINKIN